MRRTSGRPASAVSSGIATARLQLLGAHRRVLHDDVEDRRREVGEDVAPQLLQARRRRRPAATRTTSDVNAGCAKAARHQCCDHERPQCSCSSPPPRAFSASALSRNAPSTTTSPRPSGPRRPRPRRRGRGRGRPAASRTPARRAARTRASARRRAAAPPPAPRRWSGCGPPARGRRVADMPGRSTPSRVGELDADRDRARAGVDLAARPASRGRRTPGPAAPRSVTWADGAGLDADGVALERVRDQPDPREVGDGEQRRAGLGELAQDALRSRTRPAIGERSANADGSSASSASATPSARSARRRRTRLGVGGAERGLGLLHLARRDDPLGRKRALALERSARPGRAERRRRGVGARPAQVRAPQARERRARPDLGVELGERPAAPGPRWAAPPRVPRLVGRQLPEHRHLLSSGTLRHRRGADAEVAHHVLAQMDGVLLLLVRRRRQAPPPPGGAARLRCALAGRGRGPSVHSNERARRAVIAALQR